MESKTTGPSKWLTYLRLACVYSSLLSGLLGWTASVLSSLKLVVDKRRAIESASCVTLGDQTVTEEVLNTVLIEVEEILNSKPLGYLSSAVSDPDPVTPILLLMGRLEAALPQVVYARLCCLLGTRRWRHSQVLADQLWASLTSTTYQHFSHGKNGRWLTQILPWRPW